MLPRDAGVALPGYNGTNVWYAPGADINSTHAFHDATDLEEVAYLANRYLFVGIMAVMIIFILVKLPYTFLRFKSSGIVGFRLSTAETRNTMVPYRLKRTKWQIPPVHVPYIDLPLSEFLVVLILWIAGVGVAGWCQSAFLTDASRSTLVVMCLMSLAAGLGIKSGGIGTWIGKGYTAVNFLHRWTGRLVLLLATLHVIAYLVVFYRAGIAQQEMAKPENYLGAVAFGGLCLTGLGSARWIRRHHWLIFKSAHHFGILLLLAGLNYHSGDVVPYLITIWALIIINSAFRSITTRYPQVSLIPLPGAESTLVKFHGVKNGFVPGQHVRVRLLTPWKYAFESHPFTIASAAGEEVELVIRKAGDFTSYVHDLALRRGQVRMSIEGPYGGPLSFQFSSFESVGIFCGGSGISFGLGTVRGVMADVKSGASRCRRCDLVWVAPNEAWIGDLTSQFLTLMSDAQSFANTEPGFVLNLAIYQTRGGDDEKEKAKGPSTSISSCIRYGRPNISELVEGIVSSTEKGGVGLGACGPGAMVQDVEKVVYRFNGAEKKRVGGVEVHAERFSL